MLGGARARVLLRDAAPAEPSRGLVLQLRVRGRHPRQVDDVDLLELSRRAASSCASGWPGASPGAGGTSSIRAPEPRGEAGHPGPRLRPDGVRLHERVGPPLPERHSRLEQRCRVKVCYMVEFYAGLPRARPPPPAARGFRPRRPVLLRAASTTVGAGHRQALPPRPARRRRAALHALSRAAATGDRRPQRGRRSEPVHQALLRLAAARGVFYLHDTIPGSLVRPTSPAEHRDMLAQLRQAEPLLRHLPGQVRRRREPGASRRSGPATSRGRPRARCSSARRRPRRPSATTSPGPTRCIEARADGGDVADVLARSSSAPTESTGSGTRNAVAALRRHDWAHRWQSILQIAGAEPAPALTERLRASRSARRPRRAAGRARMKRVLAHRRRRLHRQPLPPATARPRVRGARDLAIWAARGRARDGVARRGPPRAGALRGISSRRSSPRTCSTSRGMSSPASSSARPRTSTGSRPSLELVRRFAERVARVWPSAGPATSTTGATATAPRS